MTAGIKLPVKARHRSPGQLALLHAVNARCAELGCNKAQLAERHGVPLRTVYADISGETATHSLDLYLALQADPQRKAA